MGARKGSISYTLYFVEGEVPKGYRDTFLDAIGEFAFRPLTPMSEEDLSYGWSVLDEVLREDFDRDSVFVGETICLGMRVDRWTLPKPILNAEIDQRIAGLLQEQGRNKAYRSEKDAVREQVTAELKRRALPSTQVVDMVWSLDDQKVRLWSQSGRMIELFESLFESTFGIRLVPCSPYVAALKAGLSPDATAALDTVEPARFSSFDTF